MIVELQQNQQRYSKSDDLYSISATSEIKPLNIEIKQKDLPLEGLLPYDIKGVIIYLRDYDRYIASEEMILTLAESLSLNPHYTYKEHSSVMGAKMGKTIPIIPIDTAKIIDEINKQKGKIPFSGVKDVEWEINGEDLSGLINQIIWTLSPNAKKGFDTFTTFDLNLNANYSISKLNIEPLDKDAKIPEDKLAANIKVINDKITELNSDFNIIKDIFYFGKVNSVSTTRHTILASADEGDDLPIQVISKESVLAGKEPMISNQISDVQSAKVGEVSTKVEQTATSLSQKINQTEATIKSAQSGDAEAQKALTDANIDLRAQLKLLQDKFFK